MTSANQITHFDLQLYTVHYLHPDNTLLTEIYQINHQQES